MSQAHSDQPEYINGRYVLQYLCGGNLNEFARVIQRYPQQTGAMLNDHPSRPIGAKMARHIEQSFGLPQNWLSMPRGKEQASEFLVRLKGEIRDESPGYTTETHRPAKDLRNSIPELPTGATWPAPKEHGPAPSSTFKGYPLSPDEAPERFIEQALRAGSRLFQSTRFSVYKGVPYDVGPRFAYDALRAFEKAEGMSAPETWFTLVVYDPAEPSKIKHRILLSFSFALIKIRHGVIEATARNTFNSKAIAFASDLRANKVLALEYRHLEITMVRETSSGESRSFAYTYTDLADCYDQIMKRAATEGYPSTDYVAPELEQLIR